MTILQIAPCYVDIYNETGGVANIIRQICLRLDKERINTVLICSNTELGKVVANEGIIKYSENLTVYIIKQNTNPMLGPLKKLKILLNSLNQITLAHIHTCFSSITDYSMYYLLNKNIPCIFTPHGKLSPSMYNNKKLLKHFYFNIRVKKMLNKVGEIITSSKNEIKYIKNLGVQNKFSFIYNGFIENNLNYQRIDNFGLFSKSFLLFLGYLDPRKQPDLLVKAFVKSKASEKFKLVLAGPDSYGYKTAIEKLVDSFGENIKSKIIFTGRVFGTEKWLLLKNAKTLILPSKGEGWPVVIAEAIGSGLPMIISKECNFSEIEEMQLGLEIKDFEIESWKNAIDEMCFNDKLYKKFELNLIKYRYYFNWKSVTTQWIEKYRSIINETRIK